MIGARAALVTIWLLAIAAFSDTASPKAAPYPDGAPPGFSGGFAEQSCHACHFDAEPNTAPGQLTLAGVPERFVPGQQYPLTITLSRPGMAMAGFQLVARVEDGGAQAGVLDVPAIEEERLAVQSRNGIQYVNQRQKGTTPAEAGTSTWTVLWTAPPAPAAVVFYVAANAADNDGSARGDYIFTTTARSAP